MNDDKLISKAKEVVSKDPLAIRLLGGFLMGTALGTALIQILDTGDNGVNAILFLLCGGGGLMLGIAMYMSHKTNEILKKHEEAINHLKAQEVRHKTELQAEDEKRKRLHKIISKLNHICYKLTSRLKVIMADNPKMNGQLQQTMNELDELQKEIDNT